MSGQALLNNPRENRGRRYSATDRQVLRITGLVPPAASKTLAEDVQHLLIQLRKCSSVLSRYERLMHVLASDETLFFAAAQNNLPQVLPMIYTPAVGDACLNYSDLAIPNRGMWIGIDQKGKVRDILDNWPADNVDAIVVSDCERILGLGDLGANGMGIPVGKLLLYSACGGLDPARCLPVVLDVGCNTPAVRNSENYIGLDHDRISGQEYDDFVHEFITAAIEKYGKSTLIQFEDFGNSNALRLLNKYRDEVCCFNDDIQGTASVGLAGILSALRIPGVASELKDHKFVLLGAGSAGIGIASLITLALVRTGMPEVEARQKCWFVDSRGLVYKGRANVSEAKSPFAHETSLDVQAVAKEGLLEIIKVLKPTGIIGVSTIRGAFSEDIIREMGSLNERPLIFALSNPTSKAECTAEEAYKFTQGRAVFASGSPFAPVQLPGHHTHLVPGQGNNSYIFPGLGFGVVLSGAKQVPESMLLIAADTVSKMVGEEQLQVSCVYPDLHSLMDISANIAFAVCQEAKALSLNERNVDSLDVKTIRDMMYEPGRGQI
ncbi:NADP-malic enzyme [Chondrus crispus]|uniref:Malic enzyme n=1 Tax=Chondrus crispus TaxID=2769 RepID=R7QP28_CHOCR|nr:NADP-malic enzyme [Chondrus crispus]CDF39241.1 NADP-malic enzyme [Chondrus crispus]|eukprot:XP_005719152.1 NADP-malic enzyme [Chondrus crispus]